MRRQVRCAADERVVCIRQRTAATRLPSTSPLTVSAASQIASSDADRMPRQHLSATLRSWKILQVAGGEHPLAESEFYALRLGIEFFECCLAAASSDIFYNFSSVAGFTPPKQNKSSANGWMADNKISEVSVS